MIDLTQEKLHRFLEEKKLNPTFQKQTEQNYIVIQVRHHDIHVFFGILAENSLLQMIAYFPFTYHENTVADVARFLHMINKEVDIPGFCLDEKERLLFYRLVIPCLDKHFDPQLIENYIQTIKQAVETFFSPIGILATGTASLKDLLQEGKKSLNKGHFNI